MKVFFLPLSLLLLNCSPLGEQSSNKQLAMFRDSRRADPSEEELKKFVQLEGTCVGYAVANSANRAIFSSGKHCHQDNNPRLWCERGGRVKTMTGKVIGVCSQVLGQLQYRDIFLFEVEDINDDAMEDVTPLRWATFVPPKGTPLETLGTPVDSFRNGAATITRNCSVVNTAERSYLSDARRSNPDIQPSENLSIDESFTYNCTTYGGNSGGPVIIAGTDIVVGQPGAYVDQSAQKEGLYDSGLDYIMVFSSKGFWEAARGALSNLGITTVSASTQPDVTPGNDSEGPATRLEPSSSCNWYKARSLVTEVYLYDHGSAGKSLGAVGATAGGQTSYFANSGVFRSTLSRYHIVVKNSAASLNDRRGWINKSQVEVAHEKCGTSR